MILSEGAMARDLSFLPSAMQPIFEWTGISGLPEPIRKGQWFTDPSGKLRKAYDDMEEGHVPWLDPVDVGAFKVSPFVASVVNTSGITPLAFKVLILPDPVDEKFAGSSLLKPVESQTKEQFATTTGTLVAAATAAFSHVTEDEWDGQKPKPGDHVVYTKFAGFRHKGADGKDYVVLKDEDIHARID